ncbi:hypothetical protein [Streptomyces europaeiscabiei]|uniref:hypothetical protein n=1 Tax=Streptomyces europaeiscabiei TaxID=146819 RepID=UPI002E0ED252|nr:hypothetical protein OHB30_11205 [Streptomyces europaeiscabiei]
MEDGQVVGLQVRHAGCCVAAEPCVAFLVVEAQYVDGEQHFEGAHLRDVGQLRPHLVCDEGEVVASLVFALQLGPRFEHGGVEAAGGRDRRDDVVKVAAGVCHSGGVRFLLGARSLASEKPGLRHVLDGLAPVGLVLEHRPGGGRF